MKVTIGDRVLSLKLGQRHTRPQTRRQKAAGCVLGSMTDEGEVVPAGSLAYMTVDENGDLAAPAPKKFKAAPHVSGSVVPCSTLLEFEAECWYEIELEPELPGQVPELPGEMIRFAFIPRDTDIDRKMLLFRAANDQLVGVVGQPTAFPWVGYDSGMPLDESDDEEEEVWGA